MGGILLAPSAIWDGPLGTILDTIAECQAQLEDDNVERIRAALTAPPLVGTPRQKSDC
jgi:hypothetical protein